jgi:hypothetical protein
MISSRRDIRPRRWVIIVNTLQALRKAGSSARRLATTAAAGPAERQQFL